MNITERDFPCSICGQMKGSYLVVGIIHGAPKYICTQCVWEGITYAIGQKRKNEEQVDYIGMD